ncbi:MAG TPA: hypothetical protein VF503_23820 [Sphingobium sp.]|uniref:hypothetical protein n=1 Tax=Sphingobium sp. TaxID=1912891 RepID=UPI002ED05649
MGVYGQTIAQNFSSDATNGNDKFAQSVASGANAFRSLWDAARQFAGDFLPQMAQMIIQQTIFNRISGLLKSLSSALGDAGTSFGVIDVAGRSIAVGENDMFDVFKKWAFSVFPKFNSGSVVVSGGAITLGNLAWFANARRYHEGGIAGLAPGEVSAVLMRSEEVLTRNDPRHILTSGPGADSTPRDIKIVDGGHMISKAMNTTKGQKGIINFVRQNSRAFNTALGK